MISQYENTQSLPRLITDQRHTKYPKLSLKKSKEVFKDNKSNISVLAEKFQINWLQNKPLEIKEEDDSLTSLAWLHNVPSILGPQSPINIQPMITTSDTTYNEPPSNIFSSSSNNINFSSFSHLDCALKDGGLLDPLVRHDYKTNWSGKPPFSYATLICMAMRELNKTKITLSDIYNWITDNFIYYRLSDSSWQNSVRHNLSLNKCFEKVPRGKDEKGKGGFWRINPKYADRLESNLIKYRRQFPVYNNSTITTTTTNTSNTSNLGRHINVTNGIASSSSSSSLSVYHHLNNTNLPAASTLLASKRTNDQSVDDNHHHINNYQLSNDDDDSSCNTPHSDYSVKSNATHPYQVKVRHISSTNTSHIYLPNLPVTTSSNRSLQHQQHQMLVANSSSNLTNNSSAFYNTNINVNQYSDNHDPHQRYYNNSSSNSSTKTFSKHPYQTKLLRHHPLYRLQSLHEFRTAETGQKVDTQLRSDLSLINSSNNNNNDHNSTIYALLHNTTTNNSNCNNKYNNYHNNIHNNRNFNEASPHSHLSIDDLDSAASSSFDADLINPATNNTSLTTLSSSNRHTDDSNHHDDDDEEEDNDSDNDDRNDRSSPNNDVNVSSSSLKFSNSLLQDEFIVESDDYLLRHQDLFESDNGQFI